MNRILRNLSRYSLWILTFGLLVNSVAGLSAADHWLWAENIGGMWGTGVGIDGEGNSYALGRFVSQQTIAGTILQPQTNYVDGFLVKHDPSGNLRWVRQVGAEGWAMHVDSLGNTYLAGYLAGKAKVGNVEFQGKTNRQMIFVARYDSNGEVLWARQAGEAENTSVSCVEVDRSGDYFVAGSFRGDASFVGSDRAEKTDAGSSALFVCKYSGNGTLQWKRTEVGSTNSTLSVDDMAVSNVGECFIMGNIGWGEQNITIGGTELGTLTPATKFVGKLNGKGEFEWVRGIKVALGAFFPYSSLALDEAANVYVVGGFVRRAQIVDKTVVSTNVSDFYMAKFDRSGSLEWARAGGDCCNNDVRSSAIDKNGNIYLTGTFSFGMSLSTNQPIQRIPIVRKYSKSGELLAEEYGNNSVSGNDIAIDANGNVVIVGGLGLEGSLGQSQLLDGETDVSDGFIAKLRPFTRAGRARIQVINPKEVRVSLQGFEEADYRIETSANLEDWTPFLTWPGTNGSFEFSDFPVPGAPAKFYRIIAVP